MPFKSKTRLKSWILVLNFVSDLAYVGEVSCIASYNILAVNNNPLKDYPSKFLFGMKLTSYWST